MTRHNAFIVSPGFAIVSVQGLMEEGGYTIVEHINDAGIVVFTGGEDVNPELYDAPCHHTTYFSRARDQHEIRVYKHCLENNIPMAGICRGAQLLNVLNGGKMYQHITRHAGNDHLMTINETGEKILVSSLHHQMCMPTRDAIILGTSNEGGTREYYHHGHELFMKEVSDVDFESFLYEETKCFCFQPHPELNHKDYGDMRNYFHATINKYLFGE